METDSAPFSSKREKRRVLRPLSITITISIMTAVKFPCHELAVRLNLPVHASRGTHLHSAVDVISSSAGHYWRGSCEEHES